MRSLGRVLIQICMWRRHSVLRPRVAENVCERKMSAESVCPETNCFLTFYGDNITDRVSCIAITGLSSHPFGSWKQRNGQHMWLRDSLPNDLKGARVLLYGYDTSLLQSQTFQNVDDIAITFCKSIKRIRRYDNVSGFPLATT
jgi:hypothetical protein